MTIKSAAKKGKATDLSLKIAETLVEMRQRLRLTQRDVAEKLGVSFQQYQKYEKGKDRLSLEKTLLLSKAFNVPLSHFVEADSLMVNVSEPPQEGFNHDETDLNQKESELLRLFRINDGKARQHLLETARLLAESSAKN